MATERSLGHPDPGAARGCGIAQHCVRAEQVLWVVSTQPPAPLSRRDGPRTFRRGLSDSLRRLSERHALAQAGSSLGAMAAMRMPSPRSASVQESKSYSARPFGSRYGRASRGRYRAPDVVSPSREPSRLPRTPSRAAACAAGFNTRSQSRSCERDTVTARAVAS